MAVDDAATDVSVSGGTPALRLKGARAPPYGGSHASRSEDYMNNPHLCLTAAQQSSTRLARMRRRAWSRPCRGGRPRRASRTSRARAASSARRRSPSWSKSGADVVGEAINTIGEYLGRAEGAARRSSRARSPSASKEAAAP